MPNVITGHNDVLIVLGATNGGWCVYAGDPDKTASEILETAPAAAVSDDEGLIEWFGEQLSLPAPELQARPPNPGPAAKPAEHGAPPAGGEQCDIGQHAHAGAIAMLTLADVRKTLEPFAQFARLMPGPRDSSYFAIRSLEGDTGYAQVNMGELRALLRAAGMFTDEMRPPEATAPVASTEQAGVTHPPVTPDDKQAPAPETGPATTDSDEVDQLELINVGADEDEGCPKGDPHCLSLDGENHDLCEGPR